MLELLVGPSRDPADSGTEVDSAMSKDSDAESCDTPTYEAARDAPEGFGDYIVEIMQTPETPLRAGVKGPCPPSDSNSALKVARRVIRVICTSFETKLEAFRTYTTLHGHCCIPVKFLTPISDDPGVGDWSSYLQGLKLGRMPFQLRQVPPKQLQRIAALTKIGFPWSLRPGQLQVLGVYYSITGHLHVSPSFVVPANAATWPRHLWGLSIRLPPGTETPFGRYRRSDDVDVDWVTCFQALEMFQLREGHCCVPKEYTVP
ncbi:hypothetical protein SDRG_04725 [Saprolegnia diclina VS20]|uniref:Helicase-associated domain-containing protein n=1 Tax=Saprolegnia diclina (strain VS20) TaxID=1156394 RepID=T0QSK6_SAPDV|nr:hypothetical protein SDRG_04725 [Saprolegnia diclina VS20]EQC37696.1 hypothetical protein SDRG_04725 [Saprolegnia diclina VS20]|eukprot:XP_008608629.1 hypothetical protein SDRG_04725 [Saprolegnia diclina VS20]